ncbi:methyltransferase corrinoid activation protein [hydrocarbon metagenome]|uniref:Methyltransferase corrinoid activation protein n=1 Tax=hydrocarbon metagenome TaxID=938273 RepID=A0A0W8E814_9ZZZZ
MKEKLKIRVVNSDGKEYVLWTLSGKRLWDSLVDNGLDIGGICAGNNVCGKCKVRVEGETNPISDAEREHLLPDEIREGFRLACYCNVHSPLTVYIDNVGQDLNHKDIYSVFRPLGIPLIEVKQIFIPGIDKENPVSIHHRLRKALAAYSLELSIDNLAFLFRLDRAGRPAMELNALVYPGNRIKFIGPKQSRVFGIAVDIGTTTIFASLLDLQKRKAAAVISKSNLQKTYGADIISRLSYCMGNDDGMKTLHQVLINSINICIEELIDEISITEQDIFAFSVAGNPVMLHFFLGLSPAGFAAAPYVGVFNDEIICPARQLGLKSAQEAECYILPQIGGFVGADTIAALLSIPENDDHTYLLVDIGTNGEVVLSKKGQMWAASAAAGPAFEGGGITCGMRAGEGAIDRVYLDQDGQLQFNILGHNSPRGICGSAVIDLVSCLLEKGLIDTNGIIRTSDLNQYIGENGSQRDEIVLMPGKETGNGLKISINQEDIRQIQLAKAAIRSAIDILLDEAGIEYQELDYIYLAGSFGNYINPVSALKIGMLPPVPTALIKNAGNAAGQGVTEVLLSHPAWERAKILRDRVKHIELADRTGFQELFLSRLNF